MAILSHSRASGNLKNKRMDCRFRGNDNLFYEAKRYLVGGVNSPIRSFKAVEGEPIFIKSGNGSRMYSEDGIEFIDYCMSYGALILGHADCDVAGGVKKAVENGMSFGAPTRSETELARTIIKAMPSIEKIRLTNSGTEAVMGAIRLARAFTGRDKIIRFEGCYHGHADYLLGCPGIPEDFMKHTLSAPYNDVEKVKDLVKRYKEDIAAVIVEPVAANRGLVLPKEGFLEGLRRIADEYNIILIFDEVITGFRLSYGGAGGFFGIKADLTCLGKIIGGGLPIGAFGGRGDIMKFLAPEGDVYQAGTFSGNPMSVTAGLITLKKLVRQQPYDRLEKSARKLCKDIEERAKTHRIKLKVNFIASMFSISCDAELFRKLYHILLEEGVYLSPSNLETNFISTVHTAEDIERTLKAVERVFKRGLHKIKDFMITEIKK